MISRRAILGGGASLILADPIGGPVEAKQSQKEVFDLQRWLDETDPLFVAQYHAQQLAEVMGKIDDSRLYRSKIDHQHGFALIVGDEI
nr:hypothetical protein REQ54_01769 [Rhizobium sp. Q54]